jgi:uncharacterized protein YkwD
MPRITIRRGLSAALTLAALAVPASANAACSGTAVTPDAPHMAQAKQATLCLLNVQRRRHGLRALRDNAKLDRASVGHSLSMVHSRYFEHGNFLRRIMRTGYLAHASLWTAGENIAWGGGSLSTPASIVDMWMHSPGHRANILSRSYKEIGVGIAAGTPEGGRGGTYTTDFGRRG